MGTGTGTCNGSAAAAAVPQMLLLLLLLLLLPLPPVILKSRIRGTGSQPQCMGSREIWQLNDDDDGEEEEWLAPGLAVASALAGSVKQPRCLPATSQLWLWLQFPPLPPPPLLPPPPPAASLLLLLLLLLLVLR